MNNYQCDKCGMKTDTIPKSHGYFENVYQMGEGARHKECNGTFVLVGEGVA